MHIGLKGTMNALFLKDLALKTHRGLRGRIEAGKSGGGNAYGYQVIRGFGADGIPTAGERQIDRSKPRPYAAFSGILPTASRHGPSPML